MSAFILLPPREEELSPLTLGRGQKWFFEKRSFDLSLKGLVGL